MRRIAVDGPESVESDGGADRFGITDLLGATDVAINRYRVEPGDRISSLHAHLDQEEVFVVLEGELAFETIEDGASVGVDEAGAEASEIDVQAGEAGVGAGEVDVQAGAAGVEAGEAGVQAGEAGVQAREIQVEAGEAIRFAPGEYQSAKNPADEEAIVLALGAPRDGGEVRVPLACSVCDREGVRPTIDPDGETPALECPSCGAAADATCPDCGGARMQAILADDGESVVSVCRDCDAEVDRPQFD